jgi:hypothetical protein
LRAQDLHARSTLHTYTYWGKQKRDHQQLSPVCHQVSTGGHREFLMLSAESVVLGDVPLIEFFVVVVHGQVRPQLHPLLRPLLPVCPSVVQPNSTFAIQQKRN